MQRFGPPPSYPTLRIPGLNAPLPQGYVLALTMMATADHFSVHSGVSIPEDGGNHLWMNTIGHYMVMSLVFFPRHLTSRR